MNIKTVKKWTSNFITILLFIVLIGMVIIVISSKASGGEPKVFGYQLKTVLSGSMEPGIKTGSIIAVKPDGDMTRFEKDDVITFQQEEDLIVTHRVVDVIKNGDQVMYRTKGDNNETEDLNPVLSENVIAEYKGFTIPYVGYFTEFSKSKNGSLLLLVLPGVLLLAYSAFSIWRAISEIDKRSKETESNSPTIEDTTT